MGPTNLTLNNSDLLDIASMRHNRKPTAVYFSSSGESDCALEDESQLQRNETDTQRL